MAPTVLKFAFILLLAASLVAEAHAAKRIVVMGFSGAGGTEVSRLVIRGLEPSYDVISRNQLLQEAQKQRVNLNEALGRSTAARELRVAGIIVGSVTKVRLGWVLRIVVFSGNSGRPVRILVFPFSSKNITLSDMRKVISGIHQALARARTGPSLVKAGAAKAKRQRGAAPLLARPKPGADHQPSSEEKPLAQKKHASAIPKRGERAENTADGEWYDEDGVSSAEENRKPTPAPRRKVFQAQGEEKTASIPIPNKKDNQRPKDSNARRSPQTEKKPPVRIRQPSAIKKPSVTNKPIAPSATKPSAKKKPIAAKEKRLPWQKIIELYLGPLLLNRSFNFRDPIEPKEPSDYNANFVPAISVELATHPLSYFSQGRLANLGFIANYYQIFYLQSGMRGFSGSVGTKIQQFELGVDYRWNIRKRITSPIWKPSVSFGRLEFSLNWKNQYPIPLPNIEYLYLRISALAFEAPLYHQGSFTFGAMVAGDYLHIFSAGDIQRTDSSGYGSSFTGGFDFGGGVYLTQGHLSLKLSGFYRRIFYLFNNDCFQQNGCKMAGGALDIYHGLALLGGFVF